MVFFASEQLHLLFDCLILVPNRYGLHCLHGLLPAFIASSLLL
jgi:hypothetical protein